MPDGDKKDKATQIMTVIGTNDGKGVAFQTNGSHSSVTASFDQDTGVITVSIPMGASAKKISEDSGHETSHKLDSTSRGHIAKTRSEFRETETKAYGYASAISSAFGVDYDQAHLDDAINRSVEYDEKKYAESLNDTTTVDFK